MIKLSKQQVISMQKKLILVTGGLEGIRDENLLESALEAPFQTFDNKDLYETLQSKAARLAFGLVQNHPFIDENKRIGAHSMLVFIALNNIVLYYAQEELTSIFLDVASGKKGSDEVLDWILSHQRKTNI